MRFIKKALPALLAAGALMSVVPAVFAHDDEGSERTYSDNRGGDRYGADRPDKAVSYINPDTGAATANPDVDPDSSCATPDRKDTQTLSDSGTTNRNVHNDACFFGRSRGSWGGYGASNDTVKIDAPATFESRGTGSISACPDPDGAGPKFVIFKDRNGDGRMDFCFQSGYQDKGIAGDDEFHARMNNSTTVGTQYVTWCYDKDQNGCSDERVKDRIRINWTAPVS